MNIKQPQTLKIQPVLNGFIVHVGCQQVVYTTTASLAAAIESYYENPEGYARRMLNELRVNQTLTPTFIDALLTDKVPETANECGDTNTYVFSGYGVNSAGVQAERAMTTRS